MYNRSSLKVRHVLLAAVVPVLAAQTPAHAVTFNITFDPSVIALGNAAQWESAFTYAANQFQNLYSNPITINIDLQASSDPTITGASSTSLAYAYDYVAQIRPALVNKYNASGSTLDITARNNLPATSPSGTTKFIIASAEAKALTGLGITGNDPTSDGTITIGSLHSYTFDPNNRAVSGQLDFIGVAEHEISEVMGRGEALGNDFGVGDGPLYEPFDLFRFTNTGVHSMNQTDSGVYFSYDNGVTHLNGFYPPDGSFPGDLSDWTSGSHGGAGPDSFNAYSSSGVKNDITAVDQTVMDVLGYSNGIQWNLNTGGGWSTNTNWLPNSIPGGAGVVIGFAQPGGGTINMLANRTVGKINFNSAGSYTIAQGGGSFTLRIDDTSDAVNDPSINIFNGSHSIGAPLSLANGLNINMLNGSGLTITNTISGTGPLNVNGLGTFTVGVGGVLPSASALSITIGSKVVLANGVTSTSQTVSSLFIDTTEAGTQLDVGKNTLNITGTPVATTKAYIVSGYNGGAWNGNGIVTSLFDSHHGVGYISVGGGSEARYTLYGDTNLDGTVNFVDLLALAQNYNTTGTSWNTGDSSYDGTTNFVDLLALAQNYNTSLPPDAGGFSPSFVSDWNLAVSETSAVPEPTSLGMLAFGATALLRRRSRRSA